MCLKPLHALTWRRIELKQGILISLLVCAVGMNGCSSRSADERALQGKLDKKTYTTPMGTLSLDLENLANPATLQEEIADQGASFKIRFSDSAMNQYQVLITYAREEIPARFIEDLAARAKDVGQTTLKSQTPDKRECLITTWLQRAGKTEKVIGNIDMVFHVNRTIFNLEVASAPNYSSADAAKYAEAAFFALWDHCVFRGRWNPNAHPADEQDPRVPIVLHMTEKLAGQLGFTYELQNIQHPIVRLKRMGEAGSIDISLGIQLRGTGLMYSEALVCEKGDKPLALEQHKRFLTVFLQEMGRQKIRIVRTGPSVQNVMLSDK